MYLVCRLMVFIGFHYANERIITIIVPYVPIVATNIDSQAPYLFLPWGNVVVWYIETSQCYIHVVHTCQEKITKIHVLPNTIN